MLEEHQTFDDKNLVPVTDLITAENLLLCRKCGDREMGKCKCAKKYVDCSENKWNFSCAYCNEMRMIGEGKNLKDLVINVTDKKYDDVGPFLETYKTL